MCTLDLITTGPARIPFGRKSASATTSACTPSLRLLPWPRRLLKLCRLPPHLPHIAPLHPPACTRVMRRLLLRVYDEMPVREFGERLKEALSLTSVPRLVLNGRLIVLDDRQPIAYYHSRYRDAKDDALHLALLFEAEREKEELQQAQQQAASMALTKQEEAAAPLPPSDLILRKGRSGGIVSKGGSTAGRGQATSGGRQAGGRQP